MRKRLPAATSADFMEVLMGMKRLSLVPPEGGRLPPSLIASFKETYPDGVEEHGAVYLYDELRVTGVQALGLEGDVPVLGPRPTAPRPPLVADQGAAYQEPIAAPACAQAPRPEAEVEGVEAGIEHVERFASVDPKNLDPTEFVEYKYGFVGGKKWYDRLTPGAKKRIFANIDVGEHEARIVIGVLSRSLAREYGPSGRRELSDNQLAMIAGSRVLSQKGNWTFHDGGV